MKLDEIEILNKIIQNEGNCDWADPKTCDSCPLSKWKKREDGSGWLSCIEAVGVLNDTSYSSHDSRYKEAAMNLLIEKTLDKILQDNGEDNGTI